MNLPTKLTFLRIVMIPVFVALFFIPFPYHCVAATAVFVLASITDFLDGYLARKNNMVTDLGKFLDPIADKMLVACAIFAIVAILYSGETYEYANDFALWLKIPTVVCAMLILCRELFISGFRIVASSKNVVLAADKLGKIKTVLQMCALIILLPVPDIYDNCSIVLVGDCFMYVGLILFALSAIMAVVSGINYIVKYKEVLKG